MLAGAIKYAGSGNDRDPILVNIGGGVPAAVRSAQLPRWTTSVGAIRHSAFLLVVSVGRGPSSPIEAKAPR